MLAVAPAPETAPQPFEEARADFSLNAGGALARSAGSGPAPVVVQRRWWSGVGGDAGPAIFPADADGLFLEPGAPILRRCRTRRSLAVNVPPAGRGTARTTPRPGTRRPAPSSVDVSAGGNSRSACATRKWRTIANWSGRDSRSHDVETLRERQRRPRTGNRRAPAMRAGPVSRQDPVEVPSHEA